MLVPKSVLNTTSLKEKMAFLYDLLKSPKKGISKKFKNT